MKRLWNFWSKRVSTMTDSLISCPKDDQLEVTRRERMQLVIRNFLQRALKGAFPDKESCSYFREDDGFGGTSLRLPALGIILVTHEKFRPMEGTICASQCGIVLTKSFQVRMEYAWAFADKRAEKGDRTRMARIAIEKSMAQPTSSSSSSRYPKAKAPPRPSTAPEPEAKKKPRKQGG